MFRSLRLLAPIAAATVVVALPAAALAHPGHGSTDPHGALHHLLEPFHALVLGSIVASAVVLRILARRSARSERR